MTSTAMRAAAGLGRSARRGLLARLEASRALRAADAPAPAWREALGLRRLRGW